jgi:hypothetical protein
VVGIVAAVTPAPAAVVMRLRYGGSAWLGWLDPIMSAEVRRAARRLAARVA